MAEHTPGYEVTSDGRVYSLTSNWRGLGRRELTQFADADGYPSVRLTIAGERKRFAVHRLVALWHLPPKPSARHEIRHIDGDRLNSSAANLAWGTQKENADDRERHGRTSRGAAHGDAIRRSSHAEAVRRSRAARKEIANV